MSFVTLTKQDFSDWAGRQFGTDKWYFTQPKRGTELVLVHPTEINGIEYHIYTSVAGQATRGLGKDAIRVVLFDRYSLKPVNSAKHSRVHRTEGATTVWSRLELRLDQCKKQLDALVDNRRFCGKCNPQKPHKIQRTNTKTGETFWGCSAFPNCGNTNWYAERVKKYPLEKIPHDLQELIVEQEVKPQPVEPPKSVDYIPVVHTDQESLPIIDEDKCSPCSYYPYHNYPFEYFNRVQSVVLQNNLYEQDINLVAGTATSTGKTILGELFMGHTLKMGMKVCYVSPLKSLTEEKRADWEKSWVEQQGYKLAIMTGDYGQINDKRAEELNNADIICMTSEMLNSYPASTQLFVRHDKKYIIRTNFGWLFKQEDKSKFEVLTWKNGRWFWTKPYDWIEAGERNVFKVTLKGGMEFVSTDCHNANIMVNNGRDIKPIMVKDLVPHKHAIAIMSGNYITESTETCLDVLQLIKESGKTLDRVYVSGDKLSNELKNCPVEFIKNITGLKYRSAYQWKTRNKIPLSNLPNEWYGLVDYIEVYHSKVKWPKILTLTKEWMWCLGFYLAEGSTCDQHIMVGQKYKEPLLRMQKTWGGVIRTTTKQDGRVYYYLDISNALLRRMLISCGTSAATKKVPNKIFSLNAEFITELLNGLKDGDGNGLLKNQTKDIWRTISNQLSIDILDMLTLTGCCGARTCDRGTWNIARRNKSNGRANTPGLKFRTVIKVEPVGKELVYDIAVPETETFLGGIGSVLLHNSRSRNHQSEKSEWLKKVGLLILDESHIISTGRGHPVEVGLMQFSKLVPESRIVFLSATLPNVHDFKTWLTKLNNKQTVVINSDWRPTELKWHFIPHITGGSYYEIQQNKMDLVVQSVMSKPEEKFLIFTHDKNTGRRLETLFNEAGTKTKFHNADLGLSDRMEIENDFSNKQDGLRVLIATSTLAWGRTLPARNVVITGVTRGMNPVDELDIIQMGGRAGRKGVDPYGDVHFICDNPKRWKQILANPRKVTSTLLNKSILGFHILAEIKNGEVWNLDSLKVWFERTLAILQKDIDYNLVNDSLILLRNLGMMKIDERGIYNLTALGKISATMYFLPEDVAHWANTFNEIDKTNSWDSDLALAWVIGGVPSSQLGYVPRVEDTTCRTYYENLMKVLPTVNATLSVHATFMYDLLCGRGNSHYIRNLQNDIDRINQAFIWMNSIFKWNRNYLFDTLPVRVKYGIGPELVELCKLPKIGGVRAKKLYSLGIKSISDVLDQPKKVQQVVGVAAMPDVLRTARVMQRLKNSD